MITTIVLRLLGILLVVRSSSVLVTANDEETSTLSVTTEEEDSSTATTTTATTDKPKRTKPLRIAGYIPDYRFEGINLNHTAEYADDLYLFSLMPQTQLGANMLNLCCLQPGKYEQARQAVAHAKATTGRKVKLWVTVGGAGRSHKMMTNPGAMISALRTLLATEQLAGVDFDCEDFRSHQDYVDYETLIRNTAKVFYKLGLQVSVAMHPGQHLSTPELYEAIDRVNLMTYDMHGVPYHADYTKATQAVDALIQSGCPAEKIFMGIPAYGRHKRNPQTTKTYAELLDLALGSSVEESSAVQTTMSDYHLESPASVAKKVKFAYEAGLGGVFFWELGQDKQSPAAPGGILLQAAAAAVDAKRLDKTWQQLSS